MTSLWDPIQVGRFTLEHRLAMAPMTRSRAEPDGTPLPIVAEYYAQRASMGLLISEGAQPSDDGQGYMMTPGIHADRHVAGWRRVTDRVHREGGRLFMQLMHAGRMGHPDNKRHGALPVGPSAIAPGERIFTPKGLTDIPTPRALSTTEVRETVADFRRAAERAIEAGADGVEIHGANGYLVQQFFAPNANVRTDEYGGSIENRTRFAIETAAAIADAIGPDRTAIRLSPGVRLGGLDEGDEHPELYRHLVRELAKLDLAYLHVSHGGNDALLAEIRRLWPNVLIVNRGGRPLEAVGADVASGLADIEAIGRWALANPDFVERYRAGAPLNEADPETFYSGGERGYIDYPRLEEHKARDAAAA
ncbi:MAG TPA: alkene reductase [Gammaproteobacteria bacterium]